MTELAAVLIAPRRIELQELPTPEPAPGEYLIAIEAAGLCGTDLHGYLGDNPFLTLPRIPGHELAGRVVGGDGPLAAGAAVCINPMLTCGRCRACRLGRRNCCVDMRVLGVHLDGGFRGSIAVPASMVHALPDGVDTELGALVEPLSIGANACLRGDVAAGQTVLIQGAGAIGLCCLLLAKARGARVLVTDTFDTRLQLARQLGADAAWNVREVDLPAVVAEATAGEGPDVVIEATGHVTVLEQGLQLAAAGGVVVTLAISRDHLSLPVTETLVRKELDLRGSRLNRDLFPQVLDLLGRGAIDPRPLVTHRLPLRDAPLAYQAAVESPAHAVKMLLLPSPHQMR